MPRIDKEVREAVAAAVLAILHFFFLLFFFRPALTTPDANSYYVMARLMATKGTTEFRSESPLQYLGPHWKCLRDNAYYSSHAPGLSALCAPLFRSGGPGAALLLTPLLASFSLFLVFLIVKMWMGPRWGLPAAALMAVNPVSNEHALFQDSHTAVCFFLLLGTYLLLKWKMKPGAEIAFFAGAAWGIIPTVRYAEVIFPVAATIYLVLHIKTEKKALFSVLSFLAGLAVPIAPLLIRNQLVYGAFWKTGYMVTGEQQAFGWDYFTQYYPVYLQKMLSEGCAFILPLGCLGIVLLFFHHTTVKEGLLFLLLTVPTTLLYMAYYWPPDPQSMRFLLPTFFIYTIAGLWMLRVLVGHDRRMFIGTVLTLLALSAAWGIPLSLYALGQLKGTGNVLTNVTSMLEKNAEQGSIIIACDGISQHVEFSGRWRLTEMKSVESLFSPKQKNLTSTPPFSSEILLRNREGRERYGNKSGDELMELFRRDVWKWAGENGKVYLLLNKEQCSAFEGRLAAGEGLEKVDEIYIDLPSPPRRGGSNMKPPFPPAGPRNGEALQGPPPGAPVSQPGPDFSLSPRLFDLSLDSEPLILMRWKKN